MNDVKSARGSNREPATEVEELAALKTARDQTQALRERLIARERARIDAVAAALEVSAEELIGLPARRRRPNKNVPA